MTLDVDTAISRFAGRRDRYRTVLRNVTVELPVLFFRVKSTLENDQPVEAAQALHKLRAHAGTLGMDSLFARFLDLEAAIRNNLHIEPALQAAEAELAATQAEVNAFEAESGRTMLWSDTYATGIQEIDFQHKGLFALVNRLAEASASSPVEAHETLAGLSYYATTHFEFEERYMLIHRCGDLSQHMDEHTRFVAQITATSLDAMHGSIDNTRLLAFLSNWLIDHIVGIDQPQLRGRAAPR